MTMTFARVSCVATVETPEGRTWMVGADGGFYRVLGKGGAVEHIIEDREGFRNTFEKLAGKDFKSVYTSDKDFQGVHCFRAGLIPSAGHLRQLYKRFLRRYKHEVFCWYGLGRAGGPYAGKFVFFVPPQIVQGSHVETAEDADPQEMVADVRWLGDIHTHPWAGQPHKSATDEKDMKDSPGVHGIVSHDARCTWYASSGKYADELSTVAFNGVKGKKIILLTQSNLPLDELMRKPEPTMAVVPYRRSGSGQALNVEGYLGEHGWVMGKAATSEVTQKWKKVQKEDDEPLEDSLLQAEIDQFCRDRSDIPGLAWPPDEEAEHNAIMFWSTFNFIQNKYDVISGRDTDLLFVTVNGEQETLTVNSKHTGAVRRILEGNGFEVEKVPLISELEASV